MKQAEASLHTKVQGLSAMLSSTIIEVDGIFVGAAIQVDGFNARRFYAAHDKVRSLHNETSPDLAVLLRTVTRQFRAGQGGPAAT